MRAEVRLSDLLDCRDLRRISQVLLAPHYVDIAFVTEDERKDRARRRPPSLTDRESPTLGRDAGGGPVRSGDLIFASLCLLAFALSVQSPSLDSRYLR